MADAMITDFEEKPLAKNIMENGIERKKEYDLIMQSLSGLEKVHCQRWWIEFSDFVTWEDYKKKGYQHLAEASTLIKIEPPLLTKTEPPAPSLFF